MQKTADILTFEEFRLTHDATLRRQRETLENEAIVAEILRDADSASGWGKWVDGYATAS